METPAMGTSFDVVCAASLHRHVTIRDIVMKTLKKLWPQSDQVESARQSIVDRTDMMMREYLLKEAKKSSDPKSAECFAERWDYFAWYTYLGWCHLDEEIFPFDFPEYEESHSGPVAPEYLRFLESQTPKDPAPQSVASPIGSPVATPPPPPAEDGEMVQGDLGALTESLDNLEIGQCNSSSLSSKVIDDGEEWDFGQSPFSSIRLRPLSPLPTLSPPPERPVLPLFLGPLSNEQLRQTWTSTSLSGDEANRQWQKRQEARVEAAAEQAGMSTMDYHSAVAVPINEKFIPRVEKEYKPATKHFPSWADEVSDDEKPLARTEVIESPKAAKPAKPEPRVKSPEPAKAEPTKVEPTKAEPAKAESKAVVVQAVPPAPKLQLPYKEALGKIQKSQPAQPPALAQPSPAPKPEAAPSRKPPAQDNPVVRPVREDLPQHMQDRILTLQLRQEIWKKHFQDCEMQEGAEPLQLQIPRNKRVELLVGEKIGDGERTGRTIFDHLRTVLPAAVDVMYQDSPDKRFGFTLLYIGLKSAWLENPHAWGPVLALQMAWSTLFPWANLVNDRYNINVVKWARWHTDNEIESMRKRLSDKNDLMATAFDYVEKEGTSRDPLVARSERPAPRAPRPKLGQHQAKMAAERRAENDKLSVMLEASAAKQREEVMERVADMIDAALMDKVGTTVDWKVLKDKLSEFAVKTGDAGSSAKWAYEGCAEWRRNNIPENSKGQVLFDRELNSWYTGFLGFLGQSK